MNTKDVNFGESLKEILSNRKINVKDFSTAINISQSTAYSWLSNTTAPNLTDLISSADFLKCSIEFLIGRSDEAKTIEVKNYPPLVARIKEVMKEAGMTSYKLTKTTKYDYGYFYKWGHGSAPQLSTLVELSNILDCTIDYLVGRE